jgi:tRNA-modifying protein YgfZ
MTYMTKLQDDGFLVVSGKNALTFLQGYITSDLTDLTDSNSAMGAICNQQGRMVTSCRLIKTDSGLLIRMHRDLVPATMAFLQKYIVFSRSTMQDDSDRRYGFGVIGPVDGYPRELRGHAVIDDNHVIRVSTGDRFEVWSRDPHFSLPATAIEPDDHWRQAEIADGLAWVTPATQLEFLPQMFDYHATGGIDFDKGCYLGQEIIARMQYRGAVSRRLFRGQSAGDVAIGETVKSQADKAIGSIVNSAGKAFLAVIQTKDDSDITCLVGESAPVTLVRVHPGKVA